MVDNPTNNKDHLNPQQPAGVQVGQELNGQMEFPPNIGQDKGYDKTLEDLDDEQLADAPKIREDNSKRNIDNHSSRTDNQGLNTPEGLG